MVSTYAFNHGGFTSAQNKPKRKNEGIMLILSVGMLFAALGSIMLGAALDNLFAQVAVVALACPAKQVIVISNLFLNSNGNGESS